MRRIHCYTDPQGQTESGLSLTEVKKRIRKHGGSGYTQHFDRDGSFQETTPIVLGNNARTTYQAEYNHSRKFRNENRTTGTASDDSATAKMREQVTAILDKATGIAKQEKIQEEDNERLMQILAPMLGEKAAYITDQWYDWALSTIHARLYHEYRGLGRSVKRIEAIKKWKESMTKEEKV